MKSVGNMIKQLAALSDTDLTDWEDQFIGHMFELTDEGKDSTRLTPKQVEKIVTVYSKHFGDS
jgi:hypothetical protein